MYDCRLRGPNARKASLPKGQAKGAKPSEAQLNKDLTPVVEGKPSTRGLKGVGTLK